jgi:ribonuclease P protein component
VLPAQNRMRRSTEFDATVKHGIRVVQPDLVIYARRGSDGAEAEGPRIGLIVSRAVGSAVERHRVARRLRHVVRGVLAELDGRDRVVIRALAGSRGAPSAVLEQQLRTGLGCIRELTGRRR